MIRRHRMLSIAVASAVAVCALSAGAYALASTGGAAKPTPPSHLVRRGHLPRVACPMVTATRPLWKVCRPRFVCPDNAMCAPLCIVNGGDLATHARLVPMPARLPGHDVCLPAGFNPGGPMIPAGKPWKSAGSGPTVFNGAR